MKTLRILIGTAAIGLLLSACTGDQKSPNEPPITKMESYKILIKHVKMDEDKVFYLDISEKEAAKLGVPAEHYRDGLFDIQCTNEAVRQMKDAGESAENIQLPEYPDDI